MKMNLQNQYTGALDLLLSKGLLDPKMKILTNLSEPWRV